MTQNLHESQISMYASAFFLERKKKQFYFEKDTSLMQNRPLDIGLVNEPIPTLPTLVDATFCVKIHLHILFQGLISQ
jgi:hypothetical protein